VGLICETGLTAIARSAAGGDKTSLPYRTNRIIGGVAPSEYIAKLEKGTDTTPPIDPERLDGFLASHLSDPALCAPMILTLS
jgi:hypothetical protein